MFLVAGLGNPGEEYALSPHNLGFRTVDRLAERHNIRVTRKDSKALVGVGEIEGTPVMLAQPQTFMNLGGASVALLMEKHLIDLSRLVVVYDELDLPWGTLRIKPKGSAAGHNGIRSIDAHVGGDYRRVRLGIGHPGHKDRVSPHVLGNFAKAEMEPLADLLGAVAAEVQWLLDGDEARFMSEIARRTVPQR